MLKIRNFIRSSNGKVSLISLLFVFSNWGFWNGAYTADDSANYLVRYWSKYLDGLDGLEAWINQTIYWTNGWMQGQGRFFPTAVAINRGIFLLVQSRFTYKLIQFAFILIMSYLVAKFISKYLNIPEFKPLVFFWCIFFVQIRHDFDPFFSFSLLLTSTVILLFIILLLILKLKNTEGKSRIFLQIALCLVSLLAFTDYEYSILLLPGIVILSLSNINTVSFIKEIRNLYTPILVSLALLIYTFFLLRPNRENHLPSYELVFNLKPFIQSFLSQVIAPIPFSQIIFGTLQLRNSAPLIILLIIFLTVFLTRPFSLNYIIEKKPSTNLLIGGVYFVLAPSLLVALTQRWQIDNALFFGKAYLPVIFGSIGYLLILSYFYIKANYDLQRPTIKNRKIKDKKPPLFDRILIAFIIALPLWIIASANATLAGDGKTQEMKLSIVKEGIRAGLLSEVKDGDRIISWDMNDATEINKAVFAIESGKDLSMLNQPRDFLSEECLADINCNPISEFEKLSKTQSILINGERVEINKASNFYQLDVLLYTWNSAVFTLSKIKLDNSKVLVDRSSTKLIWIGSKDAEIYGKTIGQETCIKPTAKDERRNGKWKIYVKKVSISESFPILKALDHGRICGKVYL